MGSKECPCINATSTLASLSERHCVLPSGEIGIQLTEKRDHCVPSSYGSSRCLQHDLLYDPSCNVANAGESVIPAYCVTPFCYVDVAVCKKKSQERVYRSSFFSFDSGVDIFYSYSVCNSTADDWLAAEENIVDSQAFGGVTIDAIVPTYVPPMMYKIDPESKEVLSAGGDEIYDDSHPYDGIYIDYVKSIRGISNGDIQNITFTHRSNVSSVLHPSSSFTAAIQDIEDGLADMCIGPFWITLERLKMASFTIPLVSDRTLLVIPKPGTKETFGDSMQKVFGPLSPKLWGLLIAFIFVVAVLSVWFSDRFSDESEPVSQNDRRIGLTPTPTRRRKRAYTRLVFDSFLQKGIFFCSAGVEQDDTSSLPNKLLLFGFGFFILIAVSAYVANLAAFLTRSSIDSVTTINGAIRAGMAICAIPALKVELEQKWPDARFVWDQTTFPEMLENYDDGDCQVMAVGYEDSILDIAFLAELCERDLVYTDSVFIEVPIAFPIRSDLASDFSYWMQKGKRFEVTLQTSKDKYPQGDSCNVNFSREDTESSDYDQISIMNMFFPIAFFLACALLAIILQIIHIYGVRNGKESLVGTRSTLKLVTESSGRNRTSWTKPEKFDSEEEVEEQEEENVDNDDEGLQLFTSDDFEDNRLNGRNRVVKDEANVHNDGEGMQLYTSEDPEGNGLNEQSEITRSIMTGSF